MRILTGPRGFNRVAIAPDGTTFGEDSGGYVWACQIGGLKAIPVLWTTDTASAGDESRPGCFRISPGGDWIFKPVHGRPAVFRVGPIDARASGPDSVAGYATSTAWEKPVELSRHRHWVARFGSRSLGLAKAFPNTGYFLRFDLFGQTPVFASKEPLAAVPWPHAQCVWDFRPDRNVAVGYRNRMVTGGDFESTPFISRATDSEPVPLEFPPSISRHIPRFVATNNVFIVQPDDSFARYQIDTVERLPDIPRLCAISAWAVSANSQWLLVADYASNVHLYDIPSQRTIATWQWPIGDIRDVCFAPDGLTAAAAGSKRRFLVWDLDA